MAEDGFMLQGLLALLDGQAPFALAESWDNVGLMAGDPAQKVRGILIALDPTAGVLAEAKETGANVLLTHHPLIFHPLKSIRLDQAAGRLLAQALRDGIAIVSCHTNLDQSTPGVSDALAARLGLADTVPLLARPDSEERASGFGRLGRFPEPLAGRELLDRILAALEVAAVRMAGRLPDLVHRAAVCGGSGSSLVETAFRMGAEVFVTGEVKHSEARWVEANGGCVIDAGHFATENVVVADWADWVRRLLAEHQVTVPVARSVTQQEPFVHYSG